MNYKKLDLRYLILLIGLAFISSCGDSEGDDPHDDPIISPNILLIIADDLGKDAIKGYDEGSIKPNTPHIDLIREDGIKFNNLWVYPTCSPTRASIISGKYGYRTGVKWANDEIGQSEQILHRYIEEETNGAYATAIVGKWHLSGNNTDINPEDFGLGYYAGLVRGGVQSYYQWLLNEGGTESQNSEYITKVFTDKAIDWVNAQSKPWFLWLAYNAPHTPFHVPPGEMHSQGDLPAYEESLDPMPYYMAAIEAMDFQIGRLLDEIPNEELDNTLIIFIGDNGTPNQVAQSPYSNFKVKGSLYQGGINVPMFVTGYGVSRRGEDDNLLCSTDLFNTIAEIAGVTVDENNDSQSFTSLFSGDTFDRKFQYSEKNDGMGDDSWTISNGAYKLIEDASGNEELYDLTIDPYENENLLEGTLSSSASEAKEALEEELMNIRN